MDILSLIGSLINTGVNTSLQTQGMQMQSEAAREDRELQRQIAEQNLAFQKEQYEYSKSLQGTIFQREDTSVQRRVKDLIAAGLNPVLAAGSGASAGQVVSTTAPQNKRVLGENPKGVIGKGLQGLGQSNILSSILDSLNQKEYLMSQKIANQKSEYDLNWYKANDLPTNATPDTWVKRGNVVKSGIKDLVGDKLYQDVVDTTKNRIQALYEAKKKISEMYESAKNKVKNIYKEVKNEKDVQK